MSDWLGAVSAAHVWPAVGLGIAQVLRQGPTA